MNMILNIIEHENYDRELISDKYSCLRYFSRKKFKAMYPKGGNITIGAIGEGVSDKSGTFLLAEKEYDYYNTHFSKFHYGIDGYVDCGENHYLAVVKSRLLQNVLKVLCVTALIGSLILGVFYLLQDNGLDPNAQDYTPPNGMKANTDSDHISIPGYGNIKMMEGSDEVNIALWNPEKNPCYFKFHLILDATNEELYVSELVAPGKAVTKQKLTKKMDEGIYDMTIKIDSFSLDDKDVRFNGGAISTKLVVLK